MIFGADDTQFSCGHPIIAEDADGRRTETALPVSVHRPIEVRYGGKYELAQAYEPEPVSGCQQGSLGGTCRIANSTPNLASSVRMTVNRSWNDSTSATRAESLNEGISVGESASRTLGNSDWKVKPPG